MTKYTAISTPFYSLKEGRIGGPKTVSFYGAAPQPLEAYEVKHRPSIEVNGNGRITICNTFYSETVTTMEEAEAMAERLNATN